MPLQTERVEEQSQATRYPIQFPITSYTFPEEARIHEVRFDDRYLHIELTDGRVLSVPLWWIPTLHQAEPEARGKFRINRLRTMLVWDPDESGINDELRLADYLGPQG